MSGRWRKPAPTVFHHVCGWTGYDANGNACCVADYKHSWAGVDRYGNDHPCVLGCWDVLHREGQHEASAAEVLAIARAVWGDDLLTPGEAP